MSRTCSSGCRDAKPATRDVVDAVLEEGAKFTEQVLAPLNQSGDQEGCHYDAATASVATPAGFKKAYEQYVENGWSGLTAAAEFGGQAMPQVLGAAVKEMLDAANLSWGNYPLLSHGATEALLQHGEDWQREAFLKPIIAGRWTGTMCLTEPHCGTDLGLLKTKADAQPTTAAIASAAPRSSSPRASTISPRTSCTSCLRACRMRRPA